MPLYFFNVVNRYRSGDDTGTECSDIQAARTEAIRTIGGMLQETADDVGDGAAWGVEVTDDQAQVLFVVRVVIETSRRPGNRLL